MPELAQSMRDITPEEVELFVQLKLRHLKRYEDRLQEKREWLQRMLDGYECVPDIDQVLGKGERQE
ncbi:hypothetical protein Tdes44962_MAKER07797 [Teratosphaeria destructans]|uniref:Uncharacterized protein n=1 Tax=Teratosphaeria destructans TaxID=418781 RepID=A0A9W7SYF1_9PEZI|nr:hypothetical protein Tdes44962_MAKER07797 [Teratosphaeria destructans]